MKLPEPALYFDVTDVVEYAMVNSTMTGIQRAALRILESVVRQNAGRHVYGLVKHPLTDTYKMANLEFMRDSYCLRDFAGRFELPTGKALWIARKLRKYRNAPVKRFFRRCMLHIKWATSSRLRAQVAAFSLETRSSCLMDLELLPGSAIVNLGAGWGTDYHGLEKLARSHGCRVAAVIYDIVAITAPQYTGLSKEKSLRFRKWLDYISQNYDILICGSSFTKEEVEEYLAPKRGVADIKVVHLAHEFKAPAENPQSEIRKSIIDLAGGKYILCVGTIEIRKNILELLHAWGEFRESRGGNTPNLVLAGSRGWKVENVYDLLRRTANVGGTVKIVDKPTDVELEFLYRNCEFTVFPSLFEGWGLPIGESLWFGKPVICADNASMPEVGGRFATYFSHDKPGSLLAALERMIDKPASLPKDIRSYLTTWDGTANSICSAIEARSSACGPQMLRKKALPGKPCA